MPPKEVRDFHMISYIKKSGYLQISSTAFITSEGQFHIEFTDELTTNEKIEYAIGSDGELSSDMADKKFVFVIDII